jgi:hypothetical protein
MPNGPQRDFDADEASLCKEYFPNVVCELKIIGSHKSSLHSHACKTRRAEQLRVPEVRNPRSRIMFGSKKKKEAVAENTWKPSAGAVRAPRGSIVVTSTGQKLIRGNRTSFGHAITEAAGQVGGVPPGKTPIAPRGYVDLYDMVRRLKSHGKTDFKAAEFAWWWKLMVDEEETCFQAVTWLLEIAVAHLKTGKGDQDVLALIGNSVALLYLHGYLNLTASATASAVDCYGKLMMLLQVLAIDTPPQSLRV